MKQRYEHESSSNISFIHCNEIKRLVFNIKLLRTSHSPPYTALDKVLQHAYLFNETVNSVFIQVK